MKITEIDIDRFRIWRSLLLKLNPSGLNVIYGPNEAGKTTVMRFVRSVLYGFDPLGEEPAWHRSAEDLPWKGSLRCDHAGRTWRVTRKAHETNRGKLRISGGPEDLTKNESLNLLLSDTDEHIFNDVFAVGVRELQQLSTLGSSKVSEYIYGLSLGPQGRQLLAALGSINDRRSALFSDNGREGQLPELFDRYSDLSVSPQNKGEARDKHAGLVRRRSELTAAIDDLQTREAQMAGELRGLRFISSCCKPWKKIRDFQTKLSALPQINHNPDQILEQLDACERDIQQHTTRREALSEQASQQQKQADRLELDMRFEKDRYAIQTLVKQADWLRQLDEQIHTANERSSESKRELDYQLTETGPGWTVDRLNSIDTSATAHNSLLSAARKYQDAVQRRGKLRRWNRSISRKSQQELVDLETDLQGLGIGSIEQAIEQERNRLKELENLGRLRLQREQMALKIKTVRNVMSRVDTDDSIPPWVDRAVTAMTFIAAALFFLGLITFAMGADATRSLGGALAATAISFAGMMWWSIRNGLRNHFDNKTGIQLDDLNAEAREAEKNLRAVHERIQRIQSEGIAGQHLMKADAPGSTTAELVECIGECTRHITELENLLRRQERARLRRQRLQKVRDRFRSAQQNVNERRQEWCRLLNSLGLEETVKVQEAFDWWQRIQEVRELHSQWRNAAPEAEGLKRMFEGMRKRVEQLGQQVSPNGRLNYSRPLEVLTAWKEQLKTHERDRLERERLTTEADTLNREAVSEQHQVEAAEIRRGGILARAGVLSRDEILQQLEWQQERLSLQELLATAHDELNEVAFSEPEMAVVEDDIARFDPAQGRQSIQLLEYEQTEVEETLKAHHEELGSLKQEIKLLERSRKSQAHHYQKSQVAANIYSTAEDWLALQIEEEAVLTMRRRFEKDNISNTLATASSYMHRISSGRYHRIWGPLGENFLCVDDEYGRTFRVEQLSGGTREQLFLAIRFALVREFSRRGVELPVVMDDLFVNFDEERTVAAVECLMEVAGEGQQILFFTCHQHLAELFKKKNIEPLWLPGHKVAYDVNKPEDEAAAFIGTDGLQARIDAASAGTAEVNGPRSGRLFLPNADDLFDDESETDAVDAGLEVTDNRTAEGDGTTVTQMKKQASG
ncbi:MAG: AAA family ATPase [Fuerstiella sp.]|nr:AAA family ATPase [Fuerstiella sp.]